jgi:tripartite-type tricarboxylate transporter receptor subunit TctC
MLRFLVLLFFAGTAFAFPTKPVRMIVPFPPGGATDIIGRLVAGKMQEVWGQPVIVENRPGAGTVVGTDMVAKSPPDGHTLGFVVTAHVINPSLRQNMPFDTLKDLAAVSHVSVQHLVIAAHPSVEANNVAELIALAKKNPGKLNYASSGNGSAPHMAAVLFSRVAGVDMVHVPFKGGAPAVQSVLAGDTQLSFATPPSVLPLVQAGRLRALAVTSRTRTPLVPGVPGMGEAGLPDYEIAFWYGLFVPAGTPAEVTQRLYAATGEALRSPNVAPALARDGTEISGSTSPADFAAFLGREAPLWARLVKESGAKAD